MSNTSDNIKSNSMSSNDIIQFKTCVNENPQVTICNEMTNSIQVLFGCKSCGYYVFLNDVTIIPETNCDITIKYKKTGEVIASFTTNKSMQFRHELLDHDTSSFGLYADDTLVKVHRLYDMILSINSSTTCTISQNIKLIIDH